MRIGLEDIDPQIAQALQDRLCAPLPEFLKEDIAWGGWLSKWRLDTKNLRVKRKREPTEEERRAYDLRKQRDEQAAIRLVVAIFFGGFASVSASLGLYDLLRTEMLPLVAGGLTLAGSAWGGGWWTLRATPKSRLRRSVSLDEMRAVFPLLPLTRAERIYCDTLQLLVRIEVSPEAEPTVRDTLRQLNDLLANIRQLETRRKALLPVLGTNPIAELEAEYGELGRRLDHTADGPARQALLQSLEMCASRMENARIFEQGMERLKVQEEALFHTLSSAQTALARMQLVPQPQTEVAAQEISENVAQMNRQTHAVEQAVEEVMQIGRQG